MTTAGADGASVDDLDRYLPPYTPDVARARRQTVGTILSRTAGKVPTKTAAVHRDVRRTFAELDADANRVANALVERGVARNDRVAIVDELPKNPSGKILKRELRDTYADLASGR